MRSRLRLALIIGGLSTYLISPDDVVWRLVRAAPRARMREQVLFATAAGALGFALLLLVKADTEEKTEDGDDPSRARAALASLLQAIGIGSLLPLPGFLLLVLGDAGVSVLLYGRSRTTQQPEARPGAGKRPHALRWRDAWITHLDLICAFLSMVVFSLALIDRVADVLFGLTALVSVLSTLRTAPRNRI